MKVHRINHSTQQIDKMESPFRVSLGKEPVLFVFDQSSSCTALTIGDKLGRVYEYITFERDTYRNETVQQYLQKLKIYVRALLSNANCICFSTEKVILTRYYESDKVVKEVRGVLLNIYQSSECINSEGETTLVATQAKLFEINNTEWKSLILPKGYKKLHENEKKAIHLFVCSFLPFLKPMKTDIADSLCMYMFLIKTYYGENKLVPNKGSIDRNHHLLLLAFPFPKLGKTNTVLASLGETTIVNKPNSKQVEFMSEYRKSVVKRYLNLMSGSDYNDEYTEANATIVNNTIVKYIRLKTESEHKEIQKFASQFNCSKDGKEFKEFEFNDKLTLEENFRCFTNRDNNIYFTVVPKCLHHNYIIPMFNMKLEYGSDILVIGTKY